MSPWMATRSLQGCIYGVFAALYRHHQLKVQTKHPTPISHLSRDSRRATTAPSSLTRLHGVGAGVCRVGKVWAAWMLPSSLHGCIYGVFASPCKHQPRSRKHTSPPAQSANKITQPMPQTAKGISVCNLLQRSEFHPRLARSGQCHPSRCTSSACETHPLQSHS